MRVHAPREGSFATASFHAGRVRQQIWQRTGLFDEGNTFIKDKLELTTGRIICIVDKTVWGLYEGQMRKWAQSVDLKIDPIIAPGNEDEKSMENMLFLSLIHI